MTDTNQGFGYRLGRSWTPNGRAGIPDQSKRNNNSLGFGSSAFFLGMLIYLLIAVFADANRLAANATPLHFVLAFAIIGFAVDEYRNYCWRTQRLHDLGYSGLQILPKRWPVWFLIMFMFALFFAPILGLPIPETLDISVSLTMALMFGAPFAIVLIGAIASHLYFRRVLMPFNEYLCTTPGDPGPNRYGPPPAA